MITWPAAAQTPLTNGADILGLPASQAGKGVPVRMRGVVTAAEPNWSGRFFMQDQTAGVFVEYLGKTQPVVGDEVEVTGVTRAGGYAPCITKPHWQKIGTNTLPTALPVSIEQLMSGTEDCQRVEIRGVVRQAFMSGPSRLGVELASGGYRLHAYMPAPTNMEIATLVGAEVRVRATAAAAFNAPLRHFVTVTLFLPGFQDFIIERPAPANLFEAPFTPLNAIAQYRKDSSPGNQVHVKGVATYQRKGEDLFISDGISGLQIKTKLTNSIIPGDIVEAVGFPALENYLPVLEDATFRKAEAARQDLRSTNVTAAQLMSGLHHADFVTLRGTLIDRLVKGVGPTTNIAAVRTTLVLQNTNYLFTAEKDTSDNNPMLSSIPIGSVVEINGIALLESSEDAKIKSVRILLPTSHDVRIVEKPSWLTPGHLLISLAVTFIILLVAVSWSVVVSQKNRMLKSLVSEKVTAQKELQEAHDLLEQRVQERTAQLKVEMSARKESELQFRAVLTERTRLAQELHDTLEQTMTGTALQLDLVNSQFQKNPETAAYHLKLARNLMRQSQSEMRHSVWGLRSRTDEEYNLLNAIAINSRQAANGAGLAVEVTANGEAGPLSEVVEENLLRIGQEAMTNVVKHAGARRVQITLSYTPNTVALKIEDDGRGFAVTDCAGPKDGHFGLLGIRERTERLGGSCQITSRPGQGTTLTIEIPTTASL